MERLTFEGNFCEIAQCGYPTCPYKDGCSQKRVWERLKQYEDSRLSPEDAANLHAILRLGDGMTLMRLRELAVADQEGHVVVQPCKIGDILYRVFAGEIFEHRVGRMKYFAIQKRWDIETSPFCPCVERSIGKTVFLTREEAEKALQEMEGKKDG